MAVSVFARVVLGAGICVVLVCVSPWVWVWFVWAWAWSGVADVSPVDSIIIEIR